MKKDAGPQNSFFFFFAGVPKAINPAEKRPDDSPIEPLNLNPKPLPAKSLAGPALGRRGLLEARAAVKRRLGRVGGLC